MTVKRKVYGHISFYVPPEIPPNKLKKDKKNNRCNKCDKCNNK